MSILSRLITAKARADIKGQSFVGAMIGIMIAVIIGVAVTLPVISSTVADANLTGTTGTLVGYLPLLVAVALVVAVVGIIRYK